jgi:hypothetical protein
MQILGRANSRIRPVAGVIITIVVALLFAAQFAFAICTLTGLVTECCLPFPVTDAVRAGVRPRVAVGASVIGNETVRNLLGEARSRSLPATQEGVTVVIYCAATSAVATASGAAPAVQENGLAALFLLTALFA